MTFDYFCRTFSVYNEKVSIYNKKYERVPTYKPFVIPRASGRGFVSWARRNLIKYLPFDRNNNYLDTTIHSEAAIIDQFNDFLSKNPQIQTELNNIADLTTLNVIFSIYKETLDIYAYGDFD